MSVLDIRVYISVLDGWVKALKNTPGIDPLAALIEATCVAVEGEENNAKYNRMD